MWGVGLLPRHGTPDMCVLTDGRRFGAALYKRDDEGGGLFWVEPRGGV
jgi:hypothetical protein